MAVVKITFVADMPPYQAGEEAAFDSSIAIQYVGGRSAKFSSDGDTSTYAAQVAAFQATNDKPMFFVVGYGKSPGGDR